jgi:predicted NAD/FAD-binding protein
MDFPAHAMLQFFKNHALLGYDGQHQWYTVQGGSIAYVERLGRAMADRGVSIRTGCPVQAVRRDDDGAEVKTHGAEWQRFDEVVFATHSDVTLALLADASPQEQADLGAVRYQANDAVLHADESVMPKRRAVWSSWNYAEGPGSAGGLIDITYWMNSLQPIPLDDPLFVTLNSARPIREDLIHDQVTMHHPVFDMGALDAQARIRATNGTRNTWFCGAWMRHGFHEDGLATALDVVSALNARSRVPVAAQ